MRLYPTMFIYYLIGYSVSPDKLCVGELSLQSHGFAGTDSCSMCVVSFRIRPVSNFERTKFYFIFFVLFFYVSIQYNMWFFVRAA